MIKTNAFYFDLDGTLLGKNSQLSDKTISFIKKLKQNYKIGIATGRPVYMIKKQIRQLEPDLPVISINGALVTNKNGDNKNPLYINYLTYEIQKLLIDKLKELDINFLAYTNNKMYFWDPNKTSLWCNWIKKTINSYDDIDKWDFINIDLVNHKDIKIIKFLCIVDESSKQKEEELKIFIKSIKEIYGVSSTNKVIDIINQGISKGNALNFLQEKKYLDTNKLIVFGDAANDISMFKKSKFSVAMKNSNQNVKDEADDTTDFSNIDDGVIRWIEKNYNL